MAVITPTLADIFEEAYERIGRPMQSGYDLRTARRSLNILLLEWQNRGLNLFTIESGALVLTAGTATYAMPANTIDLIEHVIRTGTGTNQIDQTLQRISVSTYAAQSAKNLQGRPVQIWIDRQASGVNVTLWPVPDSAYTLAYYRLAAIDGLASGIAGSADIPPRFIPALISGLSFHLAMKYPESRSMAPAFREEYEMQYRMAAEEDQETASLFIYPMVM